MIPRRHLLTKRYVATSIDNIAGGVAETGVPSQQWPSTPNELTMADMMSVFGRLSEPYDPAADDERQTGKRMSGRGEH